MPAPRCPVCGDDVSEPCDDPTFGAYRCLNCGCIHGAEEDRPDDGDDLPFDDPDSALYEDDPAELAAFEAELAEQNGDPP